MNRRTALTLVASTAIAFVLTGCTSNTSSFRFRMTVVVETPEGPKTGSSVYAVGAGNKVKLTSEEGTRFLWDRGEAVAVELPGGKTLFALLKTGAHFEDMATLSMETLDPHFTERYDTVGTAARIAGREGVTSPVAVDPAIYPMLVTFEDINDPTSVELVDPDDLAATFGEGTALKRITVQITDDPVTTGIEERLGWLDNYYDKMLDGSSINNSSALANL